MQVLGRRDADGDGATGLTGPAGSAGPAGHLGRYRARDGSDGAPVYVDLDRPHAGLIVGKRGSGKSYTLGVLAEEAARAPGVAPVVVDPMGVFAGLAEGCGGDDGSSVETGTGGDESPLTACSLADVRVPADARVPVDARVVESPTVRADALPPATWPDLVGLSATGAAGSLVWRAAAECDSLAGMREYVADANAASVRRAAANHLALAASWDVFDPDGLAPTDLADGAATVVDCSGLGPAPTNAVVRAVARGLYEARVADTVDQLPWLLIDEAHVPFGGVAAPALRTLLTRGRAPGVSLVVATQRPSALPEVAVSQADLVIAHRLTARADVEALAAAEPTYLGDRLRARLPGERGCAVVIDDATESVNGIRIRRRDTPHGGASPRASDGEATRAG